MGKLIWIVLLGFCLLVVQGKDEKQEEKPEENSDEDASDDDADAGSADAEEAEADDVEADDADKGKKDKPLVSFMESDEDLNMNAKRGKIKGEKMDKFNGELPKFACKCANDAINGGNAIFGLQNLAECWSGPDDSKYDKDGESEDCVTFDMAKCTDDAAVCAGKKHANFMYYVDSPEHTKTQEEVQEELAEDAKKAEEATKKKAAKKLKGKSKKGKKAKKH